jgi:hypothetical protein
LIAAPFPLAVLGHSATCIARSVGFPCTLVVPGGSFASSNLSTNNNMKKTTIFYLIASMAWVLLYSTPVSAQEASTSQDFQISIFPGVGTSGGDAVNHRYRLSINLFAGATGGIKGFEAGGFMNLSNGDVTGAQVAGFGNIVQGNTQGFQAAGFMNVNHGNTSAFHGAGFMNVVTGSAEGFLGAGFINVSGENRKGFSGAGFANVTGGHAAGVQLSGFANITGGTAKGVHATGFINVTGNDYEGLQLSGFGNIAGNSVKGPMIAGFINRSADIEGLQLSGFLNVARRVQGVQIGIVNITDTIDGVPIGFLSLVKKGAYRQLEMAGSDVLHLGASLRIGVPAFYNIFSFGTRHFTTIPVAGFGYGLGTVLPLAGPVSAQIEAHHTQLYSDYLWSNTSYDNLNEFRVTIDARIGQRIHLFAGPVLYNQLYRDIPEQGITGSDIASNIFYERSWNDWTSRWWAGARGGIRVNLY